MEYYTKTKFNRIFGPRQSEMIFFVYLYDFEVTYNNCVTSLHSPTHPYFYLESEDRYLKLYVGKDDQGTDDFKWSKSAKKCFEFLTDHFSSKIAEFSQRRKQIDKEQAFMYSKMAKLNTQLDHIMNFKNNQTNEQ